MFDLLRGAARRERDSGAQIICTVTQSTITQTSAIHKKGGLLGLCLTPLCGRVADPVAVATPPPPLGVAPPAADPVGPVGRVGRVVLPAAARARSAARRGAPTRMGAEPRVAAALEGGTALDDAATRTAPPCADEVDVFDAAMSSVVDDSK